MCRIKNNYIILDARIRYIKKNYICACDLAAFWDHGLQMQPRRRARSATWLSHEFVRFYANLPCFQAHEHAPPFPPQVAEQLFVPPTYHIGDDTTQCK